MGDDAEQLVAWIGNAAFMRLERVTGRDADDTDDADDADGGTRAGRRKCIALAIDALTGTFACSIYETRPQVCRDLERGSSACRGELAAKSDRPKRALDILRG